MENTIKTSSKVAVYLRVSTLDQENGIESQKLALRQYLTGHGINDAQWFTDRLSGATLDRPGFDALQKAIFNGTVKTVVVWKLDRISRSLQDGINVLCDWLKRDVRVVAVSQQLDFSGTVGQMIASVLFAVAQMERENLRENTKRGLRNAREKGIRLGRPRDIHPDNVRRLIKEGLSVPQIARSLQKTPQGVYKALRLAQAQTTNCSANVA